MHSTLTAEWRKLLGHTKAVSFLVWIYPIGALVLVVLIDILPGLFIEQVRELTAASPPLWTDDLLSVWNALNGFPGGTFLRMPYLAFIAIAFAGEYQWGTWKNIVPRQSRTALILSKFMVLGLLMLISMTLTSLVITGGGWLQARQCNGRIWSISSRLPQLTTWTMCAVGWRMAWGLHLAAFQGLRPYRLCGCRL